MPACRCCSTPAARASVDVVRITWPNGLIQNETMQAAGRGYTYQEEQRLSGSCPMIWTWNGRAIQFITDVLGVAPLGASDGEGTYFPVDHDEYVSIPGDALAPVDGHYDIRVTEELSEVSYLDQIQLLAVDHPAATEIFTNEKFKGRRTRSSACSASGGASIRKRAQLRIAGCRGARRAAEPAAHATRGIPTSFHGRNWAWPRRTRWSSISARPHRTAAPCCCSTAGWIGPTAAPSAPPSQEFKGGLVMPYLQMQDAAGHWKTVNQDMGMPAGKPKTIAVELRFLSASRKVRIVTNLCVYWDEIFLSEGASEAQVSRAKPAAGLGRPAFPRILAKPEIDPQRKQPDTYFYGPCSPVSFWNPTPGLYTRYGDVRELLREVDDRLVIMGSGDESRLRFRRRCLAAGSRMDPRFPAQSGWLGQGSRPQHGILRSVEPLPFHAMSRYPYAAGEHFPDDADASPAISAAIQHAARVSGSSAALEGTGTTAP